MTKAVFVNGASGRIGRFVTYHLLEEKFEIAGLNDPLDKDPEKNVEKLVHNLSRRDSTHGTLDWKVEKIDKFTVSINGRYVPVFNEIDPQNIPFKEVGAGILEECSGAFDGKKLSPRIFIDLGLERVIMSYPAKIKDTTLICGVNHELYSPTEHRLISNGSCTTKALAAPLAILLSLGIEIDSLMMNTVHAATNSQRIQDTGSDYGSLNNISTHKTGAAEALSEVIPSLAEKMTGLSYRVPTLDGSFAHFFMVCSSPLELNKLLVNDILIEGSEKLEFMGRIAVYHHNEAAASEIIGRTENSVIILSKTTVKELPYKKYGQRVYQIGIVSAYDNERGPPKDQVLLTKYISKYS